MNSLCRPIWIGMAYWVSCISVFSQIAQSSPPASSAPSDSTVSPASGSSNATLEALLNQRQSLLEQQQALVAQGATQQQLKAWQQQNAARFAVLQQQAEALSASSYLQNEPDNVQPNIPPGASQTLKDFLTTQAALANARAQIHNQIVRQAGASTQVQKLQEEEMQAFQQQYGPTLQLQTQRSQTLASAQPPVFTFAANPPALIIPPNISPQMKAILIARNQLIQSRARLMSQYATASPSAQLAALKQWEQQNTPAQAQLSQMNLTPQN